MDKEEQERLNGALWNRCSNYILGELFESPRINATQLGQIIDQYTARGADINAQNAHKETLLIRFTKRGLDDAVEVLLSKKNVNVHLKDQTNKTAFAHACELFAKEEKKPPFARKIQLRRVLLLLALYGTDIDEVNEEGIKYIDIIHDKVTRRNIQTGARQFKLNPEHPFPILLINQRKKSFD